LLTTPPIEPVQVCRSSTVDDTADIFGMTLPAVRECPAQNLGRAECLPEPLSVLAESRVPRADELEPVNAASRTTEDTPSRLRRPSRWLGLTTYSVVLNTGNEGVVDDAS
jgi:hypothetical protein